MFTYQVYKPSLALGDFIDCFWYYSMEGSQEMASPTQRCLPLGMVELIIHLKGKPSQGFWKNNWQSFPDSYLVGVMQEPVSWKMYGSSEMFAVRFKPEGIIQLFQCPVAGWVNDFIDAEDFLGKQHSSILALIQEAESNRERVFLLEAFVHQQLSKRQTAKNHFTEAIKQIRNANVEISSYSIENQLFVCERQAQRVFKNNVGLSPKEYFRIIRFRQIIEAIQANKQVLWSQLAYSLGYADQAHLIRDFKAFAGLTPTGFLEESRYYHGLSLT
jgi:AraC-like DNA-binding protein